ncbi:MAG TPA: 23S rRNA (pseudouridine(1915)-N(3))-methyltransferase RlmH [Candidatus Cloacimonadota bacterium]|nr:23S rRNA (pseudouridine(1915)-N(3))-methyltransferase RlmH [Candidatus Cloacimonadota bacterium]HPK41022.1 23S rRNA (pseudouridine(1915)-N(3))-methyltransferase RlmH [Candidatus Cloacimonadota bacterium]
MNIKIICIAKTKEKYFIEPFLEYQKRLLPYANVELKELAASKLTSTNNIDIVKKEEKQRILKALSPNLPIIVLSEEGMQINSVDFAHKIHTWQIKGGAQFIIGGTYGLDDEIKSAATLLMSLSKMTFTHEMIRIFLIEQLYRAFMINNNKKYHY